METPTFLYKPNFCAECGEKIERESWHFWSSRRFCENCEPVYRLNRIFPVALAGAILFFGGIFFGQMGQRYDRAAQPVQVTSTQAAQAAEKPPKPASALEPQSSIPQNSLIDQPPPENLAPGSVTRTTSNSSPQQPSAAVFTCGARTQKGTPCSRRVKAAGTRCWQHLGKPSMLEKPY